MASGVFAPGPQGRPFDVALRQFEAEPYRRAPFSARNWGHALHSLCSYPSKMKPGLAHHLVALFTEPGQVVLDPFAGSGTVPLESALQGRRSIGLDLSPLAATITVGKVNPPTPEQAEELLTILEGYVHAHVDGVEADREEAWAADYYHPSTFREVLAARDFFRGLTPTVPAKATVEAATLHILHGNRPYALSRRSHGIIPIPPKGEAAYKPMMVSLRAKVKRLHLSKLPDTFTPGRGGVGDARSLELGTRSVDAIITSPPFLGTTEFLRQNRLRLWFCGWGEQELAAQKRSGGFAEYQRSMDFYRPVLTELLRVLRPGGLAIFHLGVVRATDMGTTMRDLAAEVGFRPLALVYEDTSSLESHGRTDRGATAKHQYLFMRRD